MSSSGALGSEAGAPPRAPGRVLAASSRTIVCAPARSAETLAQHRAIRHEVFVVEQGLFSGSDLDEHDLDASTVCLLGYCDGVAAGSVRLFEVDHVTGLWQGDRLAVLPRFRASGIGAPLVRCAVATAGAYGGRAMVAHIQLPNVRFFTRLGWSPSGETEIYVGRPHQQMQIGLPSPARGAMLATAFARGTSPAP